MAGGAKGGAQAYQHHQRRQQRNKREISKKSVAYRSVTACSIIDGNNGGISINGGEMKAKRVSVAAWQRNIK